MIIEDFEFDIIKAMIDFIYGQQFEPNLADKLLIAAHKYKVEDLHKRAEIELIKQLKPENAFVFAYLDQNYGSSSVIDASLNFAFSSEHAKEMKRLFKNESILSNHKMDNVGQDWILFDDH